MIYSEIYAGPVMAATLEQSIPLPHHRVPRRTVRQRVRRHPTLSA